MGFDDGRIVLDSENSAYYAGQTIHGRVIFDQEKPETIHGIYVSFKGFCKLHWTTSETRRTRGRRGRRVYRRVTHESYELYFNHENFLVGSAEGEYHLKEGTHDLGFEYKLPSNIPSAFEDEYGHIRYRVKVVMVTSGIFSTNKEKMAALRVVTPVNLNLIPHCKEPVDFEIIATYCSLCCVPSGSSEIKVRLPVGGYCPGQMIPIEVNVTNLSSVKIDELKFAIEQETKFEATTNPLFKTKSTTIQEIKKGPILAGTSRNLNFEMEIPAIDVYNLDLCHFIDTEYCFKVSAETSGCHEDSDETHPIIIGHIPLVGFQDNVPNPLRDQMPNPMQLQNMQGANTYPTPIMHQPLPISPYPQNTPYPGNTAYPNPPNVSPYPYPGNQQYPNATPYSNPAYPNASPYPAAAPYPNPTGGLPPSAPVPGYPNNDPAPPYPGPNPNMTNTGLKTGIIGFTGASAGDPSKQPLLPSDADVSYPTSPPPNPFATASAPAPATPGTPAVELEPAFNPDFINIRKEDEIRDVNKDESKDEKKDEKKN